MDCKHGIGSAQGPRSAWDPDLERGEASGPPVTTHARAGPEAGSRPLTHRHARMAGDRGLAWRAGLWAAGREFMAQGAGELAALAVREGVARGGVPGAVVGGTVAAACIGLGSRRATQLVTATFMPDRPRTPTAATLAVAALPVAVTALAGAAAASAGALPAAAGIVLGHVVERTVREALSKPLSMLTPGAAVVDAQGREVPASARDDLEFHAAAGAMPSTLAYEVARQWGVGPLQAAAGASGAAGAAIDILATSLEEGSRALSGTLAQRAAAHHEGLQLQRHDSSWRALHKAAASGKLSSQVQDAASMRIYFGAFADALEVYASLPARPVRASLLKALASELKMFAELRNYFVKRGVAGEEQRRLEAQERRARHALGQISAGGAHGSGPGIQGDDGVAGSGPGFPGDDGVAGAADEEPREVRIHVRGEPARPEDKRRSN